MIRTIPPVISFSNQLCEILKLDSQKITDIIIEVKSNDTILVTTKQIVDVNQAKEILKMLNYYHLVENKNNATTTGK